MSGALKHKQSRRSGGPTTAASVAWAAAAASASARARTLIKFFPSLPCLFAEKTSVWNRLECAEG
jgi:hypothetical protein